MKLLLSFLVVALLSESIWATTPEGKSFLKQNSEKPGVITLPSGLQYKVIHNGPPGGLTPKKDSPCLCHYRGYLIDGVTTFDSSYDRNEPIVFSPKQVIAGWTEAMQVCVYVNISCFLTLTILYYLP